MGLTQLNFELKDKVEVAIIRLQENEPENGYYLGFSGGKDSVVIHDLAMKAGVNFTAHYNVSPIDPPEIRDIIRKYYPGVIWDRHAKGFWNRFLTEGPPMRQKRWCCGLIKEAGGIGESKILGMRAKESAFRRKYQVVQEQRKHPGTKWILPICDWDNSEVWEYINGNDLHYCNLYDEGFKRLGCVLCPFESSYITQQYLVRFPKIVKCWRRAFERYYEVRIARGTPLSFNSVDEYWEWWLSRGKNYHRCF